MADDVLAQGPQGPRRPRRGRVVVAGGVAVAALAVLAVVRFAGGDEPGERPTPSAGGTAPAIARWPTAEGACGEEVEVPLVLSTPLAARTGLQVLLGGARLLRADVDTGDTETRAEPDERRIQTLVRHGDDVYALAAPCRTAPGTVLRGTGREVPLSGPVEDLVGGPAGVWGVHQARDDAGRVVLRGIVGRDLTLPAGVRPYAVSASGIVGVASGHRIVLLDPDTGKVARHVARGDLQAVGERTVLWTGEDCRFRPGAGESPLSSRSCHLRFTPLTGQVDRTAYRLPDNRLPASVATFSRDGRYVAFQLSRPRHELHFADKHPWTPSEVAVLDRRTQRLRTVPDLKLAERTTAGLAFSPDGEWLLVATARGESGALFAWRLGTDRLSRSPVRIPGPLTGRVPVVVR